LSANPIRIVDSIPMAFATGKDPGKPKQVGQVCVFGSAPNSVEQPQNIFEFVDNTHFAPPKAGA
jgi:hypothetical protein